MTKSYCIPESRSFVLRNKNFSNSSRVYYVFLEFCTSLHYHSSHAVNFLFCFVLFCSVVIKKKRKKYFLEACKNQVFSNCSQHLEIQKSRKQLCIGTAMGTKFKKTQREIIKSTWFGALEVFIFFKKKIWFLVSNKSSSKNIYRILYYGASNNKLVRNFIRK